jgi:hypothetical protein
MSMASAAEPSSSLLIYDLVEESGKKLVPADLQKLNMCVESLLRSTNYPKVQGQIYRTFGCFDTTDILGNGFAGPPMSLGSDLLSKDGMVNSVEHRNANPNGTLSKALEVANDYLYSTGRLNEKEYADNNRKIEGIFNAARSDKAAAGSNTMSSFTSQADAILRAFLDAIEDDKGKNKISDMQYTTYLLTITAWLDTKGLSDISQGSELIKFLILKIMALKNKGGEIRVPTEVSIDIPGKEYYETTAGTSISCMLSSDTIASFLQEILVLENDFLYSYSCLPKKNAEGGRYTVSFYEDKMVASMLALSEQRQYFRDDTDLLSSIRTAKKKFEDMWNDSVWLATRIRYVKPVTFWTDDFFDELRGLFDAIISWDRFKKVGNDEIINVEILDPTNVLNVLERLKEVDLAVFLRDGTSSAMDQGELMPLDEKRMISGILSSFDSLKCIHGIRATEFLNANLGDVDMKVVFNETINYLQLILGCFGSLVTDLNAIFSQKNEYLSLLLSKRQPSSLTPTTKYSEEFRIPAWCATIATSVDFYKKCVKLSTLDINGLWAGWSKNAITEFICSLIDVCKGHDQESKIARYLVDKLMRLIFPRDDSWAYANPVPVNLRKELKTDSATAASEIAPELGTMEIDTSAAKASGTKASGGLETSRSSGRAKPAETEVKVEVTDENVWVVNEKVRRKVCTAVQIKKDGAMNEWVLQVVRTNNLDMDFMYNTESNPSVTGGTNNNPIGSATTTVSIDFTVHSLHQEQSSRSLLRNVKKGYIDYADLRSIVI